MLNPGFKISIILIVFILILALQLSAFVIVVAGDAGQWASLDQSIIDLANQVVASPLVLIYWPKSLEALMFIFILNILLCTFLMILILKVIKQLIVSFELKSK